MTGVFHKASRPVAKAGKLVTRFQGVALERGLNGGVGFYFGRIVSIKLTLAGFSRLPTLALMLAMTSLSGPTVRWLTLI